MSKTVKGLVDELEVTRQYIQKIISQLSTAKKATSYQIIVKNLYLIESILKKQVDSKDEQISQMQKLFDQSQQLQLMTEKKIAALEALKGTRHHYNRLRVKHLLK